jgi:hypothetical protein
MVATQCVISLCSEHLLPQLRFHEVAWIQIPMTTAKKLHKKPEHANAWRVDQKEESLVQNILVRIAHFLEPEEKCFLKMYGDPPTALFPEPRYHLHEYMLIYLVAPPYGPLKHIASTKNAKSRRPPHIAEV